MTSAYWPEDTLRAVWLLLPDGAAGLRIEVGRPDGNVVKQSALEVGPGQDGVAQIGAQQDGSPQIGPTASKGVVSRQLQRR